MNAPIHEPFARQVERIARKMPCIGRHLDDPLAEVLYAWMLEPGRSRKIFNKKRPQRAGTVQRHQPGAFLLGRDKTALYDLWLTGVDTRRLIAIEVLLALANPRRRLSDLIGFGIWFLVYAFACWAIFFKMQRVFSVQAVTFLALSLLMWMGFVFLQDDRNIAGNSIRLFQQAMEFRAFHLRDQLEKGCRQIFIGCLGIVSAVFIVGVFIVGPALIAAQFETLRTPTALLLYIDVIFAGLAACIAVYNWRIQPGSLRKLYRKSCAETAELLQRTVQQENDQTRR